MADLKRFIPGRRTAMGLGAGAIALVWVASPENIRVAFKTVANAVSPGAWERMQQPCPLPRETFTGGPYYRNPCLAQYYR